MNDIRGLQTKLAHLQGEVKRLQRIAGNTRADRLLRLAAQNARQMVLWRFNGDSISRRACLEMGMSRRAWEWGRAFLMAARVHDGNDLTETSLSACMESINITERVALRDGLNAVILRLPHWAKSGQRSGQTHGQRSGQDSVHFLPTTRDTHTVGGSGRRGLVSDRRAEIEQRMRIGGD